MGQEGGDEGESGEERRGEERIAGPVRTGIISWIIVDGDGREVQSCGRETGRGYVVRRTGPGRS